MSVPDWGSGEQPRVPHVPGKNSAPANAIPGADLPEFDGAESDWMAAVRKQTMQRNSHREWSPGDLDGEPPAERASLVRPYARVGGRTKPVRDLGLEALVQTTSTGVEASSSPWLTPEHATTIELCSGVVSVAEIAATLAVPIGVARVIIADMIDLGLVEVMQTAANHGDERDPIFLRRVLSGLQRL